MTPEVGICLVGAAGRMGLEIARAATASQRARIAAAVEHPNAPSVGRDIGALTGLSPVEVIVETDLHRAARKGDVIVDLSLPEATASVIEAAVNAKKPLLSGTTGIDDRTLTLFDQAAKAIAVLHAANLSPGITLLTALVEQAARGLAQDYDIEIVEMHHRNKLDAPSGTALTLAEAAALGRGLCPKEAIKMGRSGHTGVRPTREIGVHAMRGGAVFGDHTVILASQNERIELTHRASSRGLFAEGAVQAALFLHGKPAGRYTMKDVLGI